MIRRPPRSTLDRSSAASDVYKRQEQGLLGSMSYTEKYLATRAPAPGTETSIEQMWRWRYRFPITPQPGHKELVAYFNIDNGSGKVHGIYAEGNVAAVPMLREWLQPL